MVQKSKLIELVRRGHAELERFADQLSEAERNTRGVGEHWSARDVLSHVVGWKKRNIEYFNSIDRGETVQFSEDTNAENAAMADEYRKLSWDELRAVMDRSLESVLALVERLTEAELNDPQRYAFLQGRPAWRSIMGDSFMHPLATHLRPWYIQNGQREYATQLAEEETRLLLDLNDDPEWQGMTLYNLGCQYALMGEKDRALEKLAAGLRLNPGLGEFSRQDPDFASLHSTPEFEAVVAAAV
jgi:hypothetical protein